MNSRALVTFEIVNDKNHNYIFTVPFGVSYDDALAALKQFEPEILKQKDDVEKAQKEAQQKEAEQTAPQGE